jgi:hypothetical protein
MWFTSINIGCNFFYVGCANKDVHVIHRYNVTGPSSHRLNFEAVLLLCIITI